jgi:hypothetical protein
MIPENGPQVSPTTVPPGPGWVLTVEFGDEHTFAAVRTPDGGTRPVRLGADRDSMPSGVFVGPREMFAGERAAVAGRTEPEWHVAAPRRWIGNETARLGNGSAVPVVQLVAAVLRQVAWAATTGQDAGPPAEVVLVRPGDWRPYQVGQLDHAARLAGLGPVRHVFEPPAGPIPAGSGSPAGSDRLGGIGPGRRSRRRMLALVSAAVVCVAVLAAGLVWIIAGPSAEPPAPVPVSAPARPTSGDPVVAPPSPSSGTAGPASEVVPAELAATFPDLGDVARTGSSAALPECRPAEPGNFGGTAGVARPTYATMCKVRGAPRVAMVFVRYPDLRSGPRYVETMRTLYPSIVKDVRWNLDGVDQGPIAGVRVPVTATPPVVLQFGFDRVPVTLTVFAPDLDTAQAAFTGIRVTPERVTG